MKYKLAIFDFDGTLADSFPFFVSVFNQLADEYDFKKIDAASVDQYRHYNAKQMMEIVGLPKWKLPMVGKRFMSLMKDNANSIQLFDGISETLEYLVEHHVLVAVVSSNSYENLSHILGDKLSQLVTSFDCGMSIFGKAARLEKVLKQNKLTASDAIYIGDQVTDLEAAHKKSIAFGAVAWGYASIESLAAHSPAEIFQTPYDIKRIVN
ncbi:haloacid dehalogenase [Cellvibrio zantedeschiae]|uniref:Haloacid dehalogenase n=1 Tax=Cellvibrio zantedeschiae TaxID=1237077 RepID=A0ABQ3B1R9_9GAMM|nr:HAD hydrolase-like protein [Cellvibrio zantedeschiae]GGY72027.1 haloacid dehalogenase [Cellvibrio zantedeschiae]